jgi:hypothetical protein
MEKDRDILELLILMINNMLQLLMMAMGMLMIML